MCASSHFFSTSIKKPSHLIGQKPGSTNIKTQKIKVQNFSNSTTILQRQSNLTTENLKPVLFFFICKYDNFSLFPYLNYKFLIGIMNAQKKDFEGVDESDVKEKHVWARHKARYSGPDCGVSERSMRSRSTTPLCAFQNRPYPPMLFHNCSRQTSPRVRRTFCRVPHDTKSTLTVYFWRQMIRSIDWESSFLP